MLTSGGRAACLGSRWPRSSAGAVCRARRGRGGHRVPHQPALLVREDGAQRRSPHRRRRPSLRRRTVSVPPRKAEPETAFTQWCATIARLPRRQTRVLTWPLATVFGFLAQPSRHIFYKPRVTQAAARRYGFELQYTSRPDWPAYQRLLAFAAQVRRDTRHLGPRDLIDIQSFIWIQGPEEYE
jgi:hypothetical protein